MDNDKASLLNHDGTVIYHENTLKDLVTDRKREISTDKEVGWLFPDVSGNYMMGFRRRLRNSDEKAILKIYPATRTEPILTLTRFSEFDDNDKNRRLRDVVLLISDRKRLVTLAPERDRLVIRNLDIVQALQELQ